MTFFLKKEALPSIEKCGELNLSLLFFANSKVQGCIPLAAWRPPSKKVGGGTGGQHERYF
jgi:hypothetical protein